MKTPQFAHQKIGTAALVENEYFALFDEMGAGKSKQVIDAACTLAEQGKIDTVVVVCPASVRCVWLDKEIGEIRKHSWRESIVFEFHSKLKRIWDHNAELGLSPLGWMISNYEFLRSTKNLEKLINVIKNTQTLLVLDESSYIKNRTAAQTKAVMKLRKHCARVVCLNGTPVTNSPMDLWSQVNVLSPDIFGKKYKNFYHFRSEFCDMQQMRFGVRTFPQIKGYKNLEKLAKIVAPYVLRREKKDCLDLPDKLYTEREVALTTESWKRYQELKKDALLTLSKDDVRLEPNAAVRLMRLAQLTSGILGGYEHRYSNEDFDLVQTQDLSDEKLRWCVQYLTEECTAKAVIVWTRWRRERERLYEALDKVRWHIGQSKDRPVFSINQIYGGQAKSEREAAVLCLAFPIEGNSLKKEIVLAQPHAGSHGLNLIAATEHIFLSNDFSLGVRLQAEDRSHRPGQKHNVLYTDVLATGPKGQPTIDHIIFKALRAKQDVATLTTSRWRKELTDEN